MAKKSYIGVGDLAHKVKKGYWGVSDLARKIKKAYIGIGNVARPFWSGEELAYYGTITGLNGNSEAPAATTIGNYAVFGGGYSNTGVTAYNESLTRSTPTAFNYSQHRLAATSVGNYALFGGGSVGYSIRDGWPTVYAYNASLTRSTPKELGSKVALNAATSVGSYAVFYGGLLSTGSSTAKAYAYNISLTQSTPSVDSINGKKWCHAATTIGGYALFGGGNSGSHQSGWTNSSVVYAFNSSLTRSTPTALSVARYYLSATTVGDYALFGGGYVYNSADSAVVDAYNTSLTRSTPTALSKARRALAATSVGTYALFGGGITASGSIEVSGTNSAVVDAYDISLTRTTPTALNTARQFLAATSIGNYALFGGGTTDSRFSYCGGTTAAKDIVDAYTVA